MADLTDLIRRLKEATEGSRELDHRISFHMTPGAKSSMFPTEEKWTAAATHSRWGSPHYTTSLDAALTLVPEGHVGRIGFGGPGFVFAFAATPRDWGAGRGWTSCAASPAISLCIAALKARALSKED